MLCVDLVVLVRTVLCGDNILFSWGNQQTVQLLVAYLMLYPQRWGRAKMMLMLWPHWQLIMYPWKEETTSCIFLTLDLADLADRGWGWLSSQGNGSPPLLWILCAEFCHSRLSQLPFLNPVSFREDVLFKRRCHLMGRERWYQHYI